MAAATCCVSEGSPAGRWSQPMAEHTAGAAGRRRGALCKYKEMGMASLASFVMQKVEKPASASVYKHRLLQPEFAEGFNLPY